MSEDKICPMFKEKCRHCSHEHTTRPFTKIVKDGRTGLFRPIGMGFSVAFIGEYCNNACDWVANLHYCPARWSLRK